MYKRLPDLENLGQV